MNKFEVTSGVIVCSDPCYEIPTWCQGIVENVKKGTWIADTESVNSFGDRISKLRVCHESEFSLRGEWEMLDFTAGVDSGQFGFFDKDSYRNDEIAKGLEKYDFGDMFPQTKESGEDWYRACCKLTLSEENWGTIPNGVVSSSGYGDGSYDVWGCKDSNGEYIAFEIVFIEDEDLEDEEDEFQNQEED